MTVPPNRPFFSFPAWSLGMILAIVVLAGCLISAFVSTVNVPHLDLWLIGLLAIVFIAG